MGNNHLLPDKKERLPMIEQMLQYNKKFVEEK